MAAATKAEHRATIHRLAIEAFAHHLVEDLGAAGDVRTFRCARPGTSMYAFRVVAWPGWIVVAGDIGDTLFSHSDRASLAWLRGAKDSPDYLLGKVRHPHKRWMAGDAKAFVDEQIAELEREQAERQNVVRQERLDTLRGFGADDEEVDYWRACGEAGIDDPPDCRDYSADHVWAVEALRWFIDALDRQAEPYLIRCIDQAGQQEMALWWRPERRGYTTSIDEAGRYTREEAEAQARARDIDFAVPLSMARALASAVVRAEKSTDLAAGTQAATAEQP